MHHSDESYFYTLHIELSKFWKYQSYKYRNRSSKLSEFFKDYGALTVAGFALIQPWVLELWKRFFKTGRIEIYETGSLEIGYSFFGPTIGMYFTLRGINKDLFVQSIELELIKQMDSSKHIFDWGLFRCEKLTNTGEQQVTAELPYCFNLNVHLPKRFSIQFHDNQSQAKIREVINKVSEEWTKLKISESKGLLKNPESKDPLKSIYKKFVASRIFVDTHAVLERIFYWEAGNYSLSMKVRTSEPEQVFTKYWKFSLTEQEVDFIRLNCVRLLQDTCNRPPYGQYSFAYPKLEYE